MKIPVFLLIILLTALTGCNKDLPEPEAKIKVVTLNKDQVDQDIPVIGINNKSENFYVKHQVKGNDVFVECIINGITFRDIGADKKGKILLYVNGKKREEISSAAFIIKGLPTGTHQISLEVVKPDHTSYHLKKEFYVTIP